MKLDTITDEPGMRGRFKLLAFRAMSRGASPPDIIRLFLYRPDLFGRPMATYLDRVLRGDSYFSVGERELLAAWVSILNRSAFCYGSHRAVAVRALGEAMVEAALMSPEKAPIPDRTKAAMAFLRRMVLDPGDLRAADARAAVYRGLSLEALDELVHIGTLFCTLNALADALGFTIPSTSEFARMSAPFLKHGYKVV